MEDADAEVEVIEELMYIGWNAQISRIQSHSVNLVSVSKWGHTKHKNFCNIQKARFKVTRLVSKTIIYLYEIWLDELVSRLLRMLGLPSTDSGSLILCFTSTPLHYCLKQYIKLHLIPVHDRKVALIIFMPLNTVWHYTAYQCITVHKSTMHKCRVHRSSFQL